jgi:hypothetical protein
MRLIGIIAILAPIFSFAVACGSSEADPGDEGPGPDDQPATEQEIADCKQSCDKLKFFDCNDSLDQAACYQDCGGASSSQIELFVACVSNDTCDPTCSTHIVPPPDDTTSGGSSDSCSSDGCASGDPPGDGCVEACDTLQFFDCIDASTFTTCTGLCTSADATKKETFVSCVGSASVGECQAVDCYYQFDENAEPSPTPQQLADCKKSCEDMAFFDCISGADAASCAAACDTLSKAEIEAFLICTSSPTDCTSNVECF